MGKWVKRQGRDEAYNIEYNGFKVGINKGFNKQGEKSGEHLFLLDIKNR